MSTQRSEHVRNSSHHSQTGLAAVDASGFQRDQTSSHYRNRANYSLQKMKTTILLDVKTLAIKGRKFGFGLGIISQRPSKIDPDVLSQCGTQISMKIRNPNDQDAIEKSVEAAGEGVLRELPGLTPGQAIVSGDAMNTPALIHVRRRRTEHGAESPPVVDEWHEAYDERRREPTRSEGADFGEGDSTGVQELD